MVERFLHGFVAGKDFIFTYGPLYQAINAFPSILFRIPSYSSVILGSLSVLIILWILLIFISHLLTQDSKYRIYLSASLIFLFGMGRFIDSNETLRIIVPLFYSLLYYRFIYLDKKYLLNFKKIIILILPAIFGLYIFDLFLNSLAICIAFFLFELFRVHKKQIKLAFVLKSFALQALIILVASAITSLLISHGFNYLSYSIETISDYKYIMNIPFSKSPYYVLLIFPLVLLIILSLKNAKRISISNETLALSLTALFSLRTAFFRTDDSHILTAVLPSVIALFVILFFNLKETGKKTLVTLSLLVFFALVFFNFSNSQTNAIKLSDIFNKNETFFDLYRLPNNYFLNQANLNQISKIIEKNPGKVFVYPYDNFLLNIYAQTYNSFPVQFYDFSDSKIENEAVRRLNDNAPNFIIYEIDKKAVNPLDNIPNISRNPQLTKWIINNYSVSAKTDNYLLLKKETNKLITKTSDCNLYELNTSNISRSTRFLDLIKPSSFYLGNDTNIKLPYTKNSSNFMIFEEYSNPNELAKLFNSNINFKNGNKSTKIKTVVKKLFTPGLTRIYTQPFMVTCY
jgi:hypothetical protein